MKITSVDRVSEYHYITLLTRRAIKRFLNNINEGRGLISFLLVDYANLLKREFGIKQGEARTSSFPIIPGIKFANYSRDEGEICTRLSYILHYPLSRIENKSIAIQEISR